MKKTEWKKRYIKHLRSQGLLLREANENYINGEKDFDDSPEDQAADLISYYKEENS